MRFLGTAMGVLLAITAVNVEAHAEETRAPIHKKSEAMVAGGIGLLAAGITTAVGGAFFTWISLTSHTCAACPGCGCSPPPYTLLTAAIPIDIVGVGAIVGGIVMVVLGAHPRPTDKVSLSPMGLRIKF